MLILQVDLTQLSNRELDALDTQGQIPLSDLSSDELDALEVKLTQAPPPAPLTAESMQKQFDSTIPKERPGLIERMDSGVDNMLSQIHPSKPGDTSLGGLADQSAKAIQHGVIMGIPKAIASIPEVFKFARDLGADAGTTMGNVGLGRNDPLPVPAKELVARFAPLLGARFGIPGMMLGAESGQMLQTGKVPTLGEQIQLGTEMGVGVSAGGVASRVGRSLSTGPVAKFNALVAEAQKLPPEARKALAFKRTSVSEKENQYSQDDLATGDKFQQTPLEGKIADFLGEEVQSSAKPPSAQGGGDPAIRASLRSPITKSTGMGGPPDPVESWNFLNKIGETKGLVNDRYIAARAEQQVGGVTHLDEATGLPNPTALDFEYHRPSGDLGRSLEKIANKVGETQRTEGKGLVPAQDLVDAAKHHLESKSGMKLDTKSESGFAPSDLTQPKDIGQTGNPGRASAIEASWKSFQKQMQSLVPNELMYEKAQVGEGKHWRGPEDNAKVSNWEELLGEVQLDASQLFQLRKNVGASTDMPKISGPGVQDAAWSDKAVYDAIRSLERRSYGAIPGAKALWEESALIYSSWKNVQAAALKSAIQDMRNLERGQGSPLTRYGSAIVGTGGLTPRIATRLAFRTPEEPLINRELTRRGQAGYAIDTGQNVLADSGRPISLAELPGGSMLERLGLFGNRMPGGPVVGGAIQELGNTTPAAMAMGDIASMRPAPDLPPLPSDYDKMVNLMNGKPELRQQYDALVLSKDPAAKDQLRTMRTQLLQEVSKTKSIGAARGMTSPQDAYRAIKEAANAAFEAVARAVK
jgi:hypothetical protein